MRELIGLLTKYREKDIAIVLDNSGENIKLKGAVSSLTEEDKKELLKHKQQLLDFLRANSHSAGESIPVAEPRKEGYPLSSAQQTLWLMSQFREGNIANNVLGGYMLPGALDRESFTDAFLKVIERHEILRTVFIKAENGEVRQWVKGSDELGFSIDYKDFRKEAEPMTAVSSYINEDKNRPFDLSQGPLIRAALLQVEEEQYVFCYNLHHTICDGLSMDILAKDVIAYYSAAIQGHSFSLPKLRIQYKDYATWQQDQLASEAYQAHKKYWLNQFKGDIPVLDLPTDKLRPALKTYNGGAIKRMLSKELTGAFRKVIEAEGGTLFMGLLALVNTLLYRYTGQVDMVLGTPVAGRDHADLQEQIGFYVNTLPLRTQLEAGDSYRSLLNRIKEMTLAAYEHQAYPFDKLVDDLGLKRDMSRKPMFDVMLVLQNMEVEAAEGSTGGMNDIGVSRYRGGDHHTHSKYDLTFIFTEVGDVVYLTIEYSKDLFYQESIERMGGHFEKLAESISTSPELAIAALDYLWDEEKQEVLLTFNTTETPYPNKESIVSLFEQQVASTPDQIALVVEEKYFTYRELDHRSNQLAHYLNTNYKVEKEAFIGVQLDANEWAIISLLGILKVGAAYVPIDPSYPSSRKEHIIKDTSLHLLITDTSYLFDLDFYEGDVVAIDVELEDNLPTSSLENKLEAEHLAYVMYTSGSQGIPKGVMIEHRSVIRLVKGVNYYQFTSNDNILSTGSFSFDATSFEYWGPLLNGGKLVLSSREQLLKPSAVKKLIEEQEVNVMWFTAGWFNQLVDTDLSIFSSLSTILVGGDKLSPAHISRLQSSTPSLRIINGYGPTENTTFSLTHEITAADASTSIPIGRPISNSSCYILDENEELCPIGVWGELYLGGDGLARGYLNSEELTREKFISSPFAVDERLYKTGDYGRWLSDGTVSFLGRKDTQVKVRGYRIELGEIEQALLKNSAITSAVVVIRGNSSESKEIVAYLSSKASLNVAAIRKELEQQLPDYMQPMHYVQLAEFPLTTNGKVARDLLPDPEGVDMDRGVEYVAPRNETEEQLVKIWEEVLKREKIGINDDFFNLGGHSLKATVLQGEYHKQLNVKLSFADLFTHTSIASHAELIAGSEEASYSVIAPATLQESYPLSSSERRLWVLSQFEEGNIAYNMPFRVELDGAYDVSLLERSIDATIERHEILRTVFREDEKGEVRQWIKSLEELDFSISYKDYRGEEDPYSAVGAYIKQDSYRPFNLSEGPLLRAALLQVADDCYVFYYNMHHIISDGWSMEILGRDVLAYYEAYQQDKPVALPVLEIQYKDYAVWQLEQLSSGAYEKDKSYWLDRFSGEIPLLDLPTTKARPKMKTNRGQLLEAYLDRELTAGLNSYSHAHGGSLFMGLVTSLKALFYRYTGQEDMILGSVIAGREHRGLNDQIGFYVNTLALRNEVKGADSFDELFARVKESTLAAYEHQAYPFDELVENLDLKRNISRSALFDVVLTFNNVGENIHENLSDSESEEIRDKGAFMSKFDIEITLQEHGEHLVFSLGYNCDVYDKDLMIAFMQHYRTLLKTLLRSPDAPISKLSMLSSKEQEQQLQEFQPAQPDYVVEGTFLDLFKEQVLLKPENLALQYGDINYNYLELDKISNQVAHYLREEHQVKKNALVAVHLDHSEYLLIAILGILKAGGAYVPLDPKTPANRKELILKEANVNLLVTDTNYMFNLDFYEGPLFSIDVEFETGVYSSSPLSNGPQTSDLAYIIYTSGSTGKPKGVMVEHASLLNYLQWGKKYYSEGSEEALNFSLYTTISFDLSVSSLYLPLVSGGCLEVYSSDLTPVAQLEQYFKEGPSCIKMTPAHINLLQGLDIQNTTIACAIVGGEALHEQQVKILRELNPEMRIYNEYGPTEATVGCIVYKVEEAAAPILIGKPISNSKVYILGKDQELLPLGSWGEIYLGGSILARSYHGDEVLSETSFIENPYNGDERLYRSGDLGRWMPDGNIEYGGRKDKQVKIRGYRVELGEIIGHLSKIPGVEAAHVEVQEDHSGEKQVVAYLISQEDISTTSIQGILRNELPEYMLPSQYVALEEFPLTPNGKIDREALASAAGSSLSTGTTYVAPENEIEERLVAIWSEVLQREKIGIQDNFFDLGGHSLKAVNLVHKIEKAFDVKLKMDYLFSHPTIQTVGKEIKALLWLRTAKETDNKNREVVEL